MPFQTIQNLGTRYALVSFDRNGIERRDDPDGKNGLLSARLIEMVAQEKPTNVFLFSHGWKGDVPAAVDQYDRWIGAMVKLDADAQRMAQAVPGFKPLWIGVHWPSQPWGDEEIGSGPSFALGGPDINALLESYVDRLGDTPAIRSALTRIFDSARKNAAAQQLPAEAKAAYQDLDKALGLGSDGEAPGDDREPFDPDRAFNDSESPMADFGGLNLGGILSPLRQLSFWTMKKRANSIGEAGMHSFLKGMLTAAPSAKFHLMGHSFGCIVMSSMLGGPGGASPLPRPVSSLTLVQGALSLWSYSPDMAVRPGRAGYFHRVHSDGKVAGPLVTTRSRFDTAVGKFYPLAAGALNQVAFAGPGELPTYGGVGSFGIQGITGAQDGKLQPASAEYGFAPGQIYNLESSQFICKGEGASGAHSDIDGPEVAHALWQAALVGSQLP